MSYLIPKDYSVLIQEKNILQIISNDESVRSRAQLAGEAEAQSYLKQKYDISQEFKNTNRWDMVVFVIRCRHCLLRFLLLTGIRFRAVAKSGKSRLYKLFAEFRNRGVKLLHLCLDERLQLPR